MGELKLVGINEGKRFIKDFLSLPKELYGKNDNMEDPSDIKKILLGTHPLSSYFGLSPFIVYDGESPVGRFAITEYEGDSTAYLGFFECINDKNVSRFLFEKAYEYCKDRGFLKIEGPVDASFWIKYRLKINRFDVLPYTGEPYNKDYYYDLFLDAGFKVSQHYTSNLYRSVDDSYVNEKYEERFKSFSQMGYRIESPREEDFDKCLDDVYRMVTELYGDFPIFKDVSQDDFKKVFSSYKQIMNMSMTKIAYYKDKAVGFYVSVPDYGNIVYHLNPVNLMKILRLKKKPKRYVMLYMGVEPDHQGLGKAIVYSIMKELMASGLPSIGALARDGKITQKYAFDDVTDVYEYVLLEREISNFDSNPLDCFLKRAYEKWGDRPYLHHEGGVIKDKTFGEFIRDVNYVAKYLLDNGFKGSNIGIFSPNSIEWMTIDIAVMNYVGISAGFPKEWNVNDVSYGLKKCDISLLFYSRALADVVNEVRGEFPDVRFICIEDEWESILSQGKGSLEGMRVNRTTDSDADVLGTGFSFKFADNDANGLRDDFSSQPADKGDYSFGEGSSLQPADKDDYSFGEGFSSQPADRNRDSLGEGIQLHPVDQDSVVRIVFTSGTTSFPKAVMLTMTNIFAGWRSLARRVSVGPEDVCYLFLPLNHTYGGIFNFIYSLVFGFRVCLTTSIRNMAQEMMQIRPSIFCAVPIVLTRLQAGAEQAGISVSTLMGGKMRYLFCGGAPLTPELRQAYLDAGIEVLNAYALSETSSSLSIDYPGDPVNNSAGTIFEDIEVKVVNPDADDCSRMDDSGADAYGEIAVRGDNVFAGYYGDEAATAAVMTEDGFFLTGDIGCINDNHIYLKGRKDSRLVFANGEKISAAAVSERVQGLDERIKSVKVYIRDNTLTCDIYVAFGQDKTISSGADNEIFGKLQQLIDTMNQQVSKYERVGKYNIYNADRLLK